MLSIVGGSIIPWNKMRPSLDPETLITLLDILNPTNEPGRITLIARFGHENVEKHLPGFIDMSCARR